MRPRARLAVHLSHVLGKAPTKRMMKKLMPVSVGYDAAGKPTPALNKRLEKEGGLNQAIGDQLITQDENGIECIFLNREEGGESLELHLSFLLKNVLASLPIPKVMTYPNPSGDGWETVSFVRPAQN